MGQASGGTSESLARFCLCLGNDDRNENINDWMFCKGCENFYHRKCNFISDDEYNRIMDGGYDWYCGGYECQRLIVAVRDGNDSKRPVRERLRRKCKKKFPDRFPESQSVLVKEVSEFGRVRCDVCGFLAKNSHGLSIHVRKHRNDFVSIDDLVLEGRDDDALSGQVSSNLEGISGVLDDFGCLLNRCRLMVPLTRIIQKSVRTVVCQELARVIENLLEKDDVTSWMRLLAFPYLVLSSKSKGRDGVNVIRSNLSSFRSCTDVSVALTEVLRNKGIPFSVDKSVNRDSVVIKAANRKVSEGDMRGAVRVLCSNESVAPQSSETVAKLRAKHPEDNGEVFEEIKLEGALPLTEVQDVVRAIRSFPLSSSGGIGGLRPRHLKDLMSFTCGDSANRLLKTIAALVDVIKGGKVRSEVAKILFGASLTALLKGEDDVRPIAVGIVWRRLAGKIACSDIRQRLVEKLKPVQLGFGIEGGAEALVHAVRRFCTAGHKVPMALVKFDFKNAFNMLFRKFMLGEVKDICPELLPLLQQAYRLPSNLYYTDEHEPLFSKRGYQQGDPLGVPGFCIGIMRMTHSLLSRLNGWYLDDGTIGDVLPTVLGDIKKILSFCDVSGLSLNANKCEVFFVNASAEEEAHMYAEISALLPGIKRIDESSLEILGSPIFESGLERMFSSKIESISLMCDRLRLMDVHPALCVFRKSLSSCRFNYLLRSCRAFLLLDKLKAVDEVFRSTLEAIANTRVDGFSWDQASLPLSFGGMGIRKVEDLAMPAYLSSIYSSSDLSDKLLEKFDLRIIDDDILHLIEEIPQDYIPDSDALKKVQKNWDLPRINSKFSEMFDSSEPTARARLLASSTKESSKWLQVVPSSQLGLLLDNNSARIAVGLRLGCQLCEEHKCLCGKNVKKDGLHGLSCNKSGGWISGHDEVNKIFSHAFSSAGFPNLVQPPGISRDDGKRPDGMTLIPWSHGRPILWDVTIRDTLAPSYINQSSKKAGSIADNAERFKHNHYICLKDNYLFTPIAFESLGSMGPETKTFIKKLGSLMHKASGEPRSMDYLLQKVSIAIQRRNSSCILGTLGRSRIDDFYLL